MEINVERTNLISILKTNASIHKSEYNELVELYLHKVAFEAVAIKCNAENRDIEQSTRITAVKPQDYSKDYETVIGMLELSTDKEFKLSEKDYKKYVLNEWEWSGSLFMTKSSYGLS